MGSRLLQIFRKNKPSIPITEGATLPSLGVRRWQVGAADLFATETRSESGNASVEVLAKFKAKVLGGGGDNLQLESISEDKRSF